MFKNKDIYLYIYIVLLSVLKTDIYDTKWHEIKKDILYISKKKYKIIKNILKNNKW